MILIDYGLNPLLFLKNMCCSSKYRFAFYVGKRALLCSSSSILQIKVEDYVEGIWVDSYTFLLPLG